MSVADARSLEKYYRLLFVLPSSSKLAVFVALLIACYTALGFFKGGVLVAATCTCFSLSILLTPCTKALNARRRAGLLLFVLPYAILVELAFGSPLCGAAASMGLVSLAAIALGCWWLCLPPLLVLSISRGLLSRTFLIAVVSCAIGLAYFASVRTVAARTCRGGYRLVGAFIKDWLGLGSEELEKELANASEPARIGVHVFKFAGSKSERVVVVPEAHFGPFRSVGSSLLPYMIYKAFAKKGAREVVVLHGAGSHERDLASKADAEKLVEAALRAYDQAIPADVGRPYRVSIDELELLVLPCKPRSIVVVSRPKGMDDIVWDAQEKLKDKAVIVDAHNALGSRINDAEKVVKAVEQALSTPWEPLDKISVGYGCSEYRGSCACSSLVKALVVDGKGLMIFHANNMELGLREDIRTECSKLGIDVEPVTIDDHSCAAVNPGKGAPPLPRCREAIEAARLAVERAVKRSDYCTVSYGYSEAEVRVLGESVDKFIRLCDATAKTAIALLPLLFFAPIMLCSLL